MTTPGTTVMPLTTGAAYIGPHGLFLYTPGGIHVQPTGWIVEMEDPDFDKQMKHYNEDPAVTAAMDSMVSFCFHAEKTR